MTNPFTRLFRARDKPSKRTSPKDAVSAAPTFYFGSSISGKSVTARSTIQLSTVYPAVLSGDGIDFHVALVVPPHQAVQVRRAKAAAFSTISLCPRPRRRRRKTHLPPRLLVYSID